MKNTKQAQGKMPVVPQGYKNGGKVAKCADGGLIRTVPMTSDCTGGTGVRSKQDYKK